MANPTTDASTKCLDKDGNEQQNVRVMFKMLSPPSVEDGYVFDRTWKTAVSNVTGDVTVALYKGASYYMKTSAAEELVIVTVPASAGATFEIPNAILDLN